MKDNISKLRIFLFLAGITIVFWLFYMAVAPLGYIHYDHNCRDFEFLSRPTPPDRVEIYDKGCKYALRGNPVYFNLRTLRPFKKATFLVKYERKGTPGIFEMGLLSDKSLWRYSLKPVSNPFLDNLPWTKKMYGDISFYQKEGNFAEIADLSGNLDDYSRVATYNYDLSPDFVLRDKDVATTTFISHPLRGQYSSYLYHGGGKLFLDFEVFDLNKNKDFENYTISLFQKSKKIAEKAIADRGDISEGSATQSPVSEIKFQTEDLPEGVYKVDFNANDDVVTERFNSNAHKQVFSGQLRLHRRVDRRPLLLHGNGNLFQATTMVPSGLGEIQIASGTLRLDETYKQHQYQPEKDLSSIIQINIPMDEIMISSNGLLSFSRVFFFDPLPKKIDNSFKESYFDYIVADYKPPLDLGGGMYEQEVAFDLSGGYEENGLYGFMFSAPNLGGQNEIVIHDIEVDLRGRSIFEKILNHWQ